MSIFFKARGNPSFGIFIIRFSIGLFFLLAGMEKVGNIEGFINSVKAMGVLNDNLSFIYGFILPFAEIFFGTLFIIGFLTPVTSFFLSLMLTSIIIATGAVPQGGLPFSYNLILLACTLTTMFSGAGAFSIDVFLDRKKRMITVSPEPSKKEKAEVKTELKTDNIKDATFEPVEEKK